MEKQCTVGQVTNNNIILRMRIARCILKATVTHSQYEILPFHGNSGRTNAPQWYFILTLPVLLRIISLYNLKSAERRKSNNLT